MSIRPTADLTLGSPRVTLLATYPSTDGGATMTNFTHNLLEPANAAMRGVVRSRVECAF